VAQASSVLNIATISGSTSSDDATFVGAGQGQTDGEVDITDPVSGCDAAADAPIVVQVPTYFLATGADPLLSADCSLGTGGAGFTVHYQVLDQFGNPMAVGGMTPLETVLVNGKPTDINERPFATPPSTNSDGTFEDTPLGSCFGPPIPSGNPCATDQQFFNITLNGATLPITTAATSRQCLQGIRLTVTGNPGGTQTFSIGTVN
jgi:hypothetical protein